MIHLGDYPVGSTVYVPFNTFDKDDGSSITMTGLAVTDIEIYKNGNVTQRASDNGYTLLDTDGIDFDAITGLHGLSVDTADNSTAGFFCAGADYWVAVSTITVDAVTVSFWAAIFSIENRRVAGELIRTTIATLASQTSFTLTAGSADNDAYNDCVAVISDIASAVQKCVAVVDDYTGSTKTITLRADPAVFTMAAGDNITILADRSLKPLVPNRLLDVTAANKVNGVVLVDTVTALTGNTAQTGDSFARIGATGSGLTSLATPTNITAGTITTVTNVTNAPTAGDLTATMKTSVTTAATAATPVAASVAGAVGSVTGAVGSVAGNVGGNVTGSVGSLAAQAKADVAAELATYDAPTFAELDARTDAIDAAVADLPTNAELATALGTADDAVLAQVALVKAKTDALPSDPADQSLIIAATDAIVAAIAALNNLNAAGVRTAVGLASANLDTQLDALPTAAELATAFGTADDAMLAAIAALSIPSAAANATAVLSAATTTPIAANIKKVNDVVLVGDGAATPWGP